MKFRTSPTGKDFEIQDEWWSFVEMEKFRKNSGEFYCYGRQPNENLVEVVDFLDVEPPVRAEGIVPFKKYKLVPVLFAIASPECSLPPVKVKKLNQEMGYRYRVTNGYHRYYASAAVGFSKLPVVIEEVDWQVKSTIPE